jgi:hypothetical protein
MFVDYHLDKYFNTSNQKCQFSQGIIPFGGPLEGYKNTGDERMEQQNSKSLRPGLVGTAQPWWHLRVVDKGATL